MKLKLKYNKKLKLKNINQLTYRKNPIFTLVCRICTMSCAASAGQPTYSVKSTTKLLIYYANCIPGDLYILVVQ